MHIMKIQTANNSVVSKGRIVIPQIRMPEKFAIVEKEAGRLIARELEKLGDVGKVKEIISTSIYNGRSHYVNGINEAMSKEFAEKVYAKV